MTDIVDITDMIVMTDIVGIIDMIVKITSDADVESVIADGIISGGKIMKRLTPESIS